MAQEDIFSQVKHIVEQQERYNREKDVFVYYCALDRGDFETVERILERAQADPELEQMIVEMHEALAEEEE